MSLRQVENLLAKVRFFAIQISIGSLLALPVSALDPNKAISQFTHTSWSVKDGIPGPVAAIEQTPDGYLWLGTHAGLYRFDGQNFVSWEPVGNSVGLPQSFITALLAARDGSLWIGYRASAVSRLQDGVLRTYTPADGLHTGGTLSLAEDRSGSIWAGGASGFSRFANGKWSRVGAEFGYRAPGARQLLVDHRGTLLVATDGFNFGLNTDSVRVNTILKLRPDGKHFEATGQPVGYVAQLAEAPDGEIWMAEASDPGPTVRAVEGRSGPNIERAVQTAPLSILFDGKSGLWIGLIRGGIKRAPDFKHLERASFDGFEGKDGLSSDGVRVIFKDREGNLWFGTNRGLDRFRENKATPLSLKEGLSPNPRVALTSTRDGNVWIANSPRDLLQHFFEAGSSIRHSLPIPHLTQPAFSASTLPRTKYGWEAASVWPRAKKGRFLIYMCPALQLVPRSRRSRRTRQVTCGLKFGGALNPPSSDCEKGGGRIFKMGRNSPIDAVAFCSVMGWGESGWGLKQETSSFMTTIGSADIPLPTDCPPAKYCRLPVTALVMFGSVGKAV